jgi:hypothetical protein
MLTDATLRVSLTGITPANEFRPMNRASPLATPHAGNAAY